jgi:uncharacterized membrane protein
MGIEVSMSRNLYILGATLFVFAVISFGMTFTTGPYQIGLPGNGSLWKTIGLFLLLASLFAAFAGVMTHMFEQVDRRAREREYRESLRSKRPKRDF